MIPKQEEPEYKKRYRLGNHILSACIRRPNLGVVRDFLVELRERRDVAQRVIEELEMIVNLHPKNTDDVLRRCMKRLSGESK